MDRVVIKPKEGGPIRFLLMSLLDTTQQALESAMSGSALRNTLLTNNLANVDTPGYQPEDVNFQSTLQSAIASGQPIDQVTFQPYTVQQAVGPDGNGVSPEQQQAALSQNGLLYETLTQSPPSASTILAGRDGDRAVLDELLRRDQHRRQRPHRRAHPHGRDLREPGQRRHHPGRQRPALPAPGGRPPAGRRRLQRGPVRRHGHGRGTWAAVRPPAASP